MPGETPNGTNLGLTEPEFAKNSEIGAHCARVSSFAAQAGSGLRAVNGPGRPPT